MPFQEVRTGMNFKMDIKTERKKRGWSQVRLAKLIGVSMTTIQLWERGGMKPSEKNWEKLCETFAE